MNKTYFEILRAGVNTTIQDKGRNHLYHIGITVSGAIDQRNYILANKLVDNELNLAEPSLVKPGNKVSFYQISKEEYLNFNE